jgi:hypothetical protein
MIDWSPRTPSSWSAVEGRGWILVEAGFMGVSYLSGIRYSAGTAWPSYSYGNILHQFACLRQPSLRQGSRWERSKVNSVTNLQTFQSSVRL